MSPASAQVQVQQQIQSLQQQNQQLQQQDQELMQRLNGMSDAIKQQQNDINVIKTQQAPQAVQTAASGWNVGILNGRPTLSSPDGRNSIALVGRLQFDVGEYFRSNGPGPAATDKRISNDLNSGYNLRRGRLGINGTYDNDWNYAFVTEFGNINTSNTQTTGTRVGSNVVTGQILTASLAYTGFSQVALVAGYTDVDNGFATAVSSADITFNERPSIDFITNSLDAGEPRAAFGLKSWGQHWYGSAWVTGPANSVPGNGQQSATVMRGVYVPVNDNQSLLHFGVNGSYVFSPPRDDTATGTAGNGVPLARSSFRFSDRPELRIDPTQFLDTGNINGSHADTYGVEVAGKWQSLWFDAEYKGIGVNQIAAPSGTTPAPFLNFSGYYAEVGYFLTGESRPYKITKAVWDTVVPDAPLSKSGGWGAWEIAGRYSTVNLNSGRLGQGGVLGGKQQVYQAGLNWYPVRYVRFMLDYLNAGIDKRAQVASAGVVPGVTQQGTNFQALVLRTQVSW
ncbi:MAG TPA: porin [Alphaproteobacteria bacterium]